MKKISANQVLSELMYEYNMNASAAGYYREVGYARERDKCEYAKSCIRSIMKSLLKEDVDYESIPTTKTTGSTTYTYWELREIA